MSRGTAWTRERRRTVPWDPAFAERAPLFAPIRDAARSFAGLDAFPSPERIDEALAPLAGVRFVATRPRPSRGWRPTDKPTGGDRYDARITHRGEVPTRPGSWHDLANALVWATFPKSKRALHARQDRLIAAAEGPSGASSRRSRELDVLALIDEGGVLGGEEGGMVLFGHALYEALVLGARPMTGIFVRGRSASLSELDAELAAALDDPSRFLHPGHGTERLAIDIA